LKRAILLVLDGVGVGALPDADEYGDVGSDTLGNTALAMGGLSLPNLQRMGLGNIGCIKGVAPVDTPEADWGKMAEASKGKDSTTGHWEMMGLISRKAMPTFPDGFPSELIDSFSEKAGVEVIGNEAASGTEIIERLGGLHRKTGAVIVYTSADSVFQIAAHEETVPPEQLYEYCRIARSLLTPPLYGVSRVIARPFLGSEGAYYRTSGRRDFSVPPHGETLLDVLTASGIDTGGVGKIGDLFACRGIRTEHTGSNSDAMKALERMLIEDRRGLVFANFCDFDSKWGHRNDVQGFANGLMEVDSWLPGFLELLGGEDILIITADHGNDPTTPSTDHSREYVPLLVHRPGISGQNLGTRKTFSDIACTLAEFFDLQHVFPGKSFKGVLW
jgi:phosphopentomutase